MVHIANGPTEMWGFWFGVLSLTVQMSMGQNVQVRNPGSNATALGGNLPEGGVDTGTGLAAPWVQLVDANGVAVGVPGAPLTTSSSPSVGLANSSLTIALAVASSSTLLSARPTRKSFAVYNSSASVSAYINEGGTASNGAGGFNWNVGAGQTLSLSGNEVFIGQYNYISDSADGSYLQVTERF